MELDVAPGSQRKPSWVEDNKPCAAYRAQTLRQHPSLMAAARELEDSLAVALRSSAIEWAVNVQICDLIKENRHLAPLALARIEERLRKDSPSPVHLALSLLEMLVKNCGLIICQAINPDLAETLVSLVKKRESWRYGFGRNLHKTGLSEWLPQGIAIGEDQRAQWRQATQKDLQCTAAAFFHTSRCPHARPKIWNDGGAHGSDHLCTDRPSDLREECDDDQLHKKAFRHVLQLNKTGFTERLPVGQPTSIERLGLKPFCLYC
eukprot:s2302_g5.t3